jgi:MFS family permease
MTRERINFFFLNLGHFFDHFLILIFATVAVALAVDRKIDIPGVATEWGMSYSEFIPYATAGFVAFGVFSIPAAWIADKWSRPGMIAVFFLGMGTAAMLAALSQTPWHLAAAVFIVGMMGAIYHPVGLALVVQGRVKTGVPLAVNGVFGNLGVAAAPLVTLFLIELFGWRTAFLIPGAVCFAVGIVYTLFLATGPDPETVSEEKQAAVNAAVLKLDRGTLIRVFAIIFFTAAIGSFIFQSTTFALPKIFDERLAGFAASAKEVGWWAFAVFAVASVAQLAVGYLVDRFSVRAIFALVAGLQAVFFTLMLNLTGANALIVAVCFMLVVFGQIPINDVLVGRVAKSEWRARAYSARYIITFAVMATTIPALSFIHGNWGFTTLFMMMAVGAAIIFCTVLFLPNTKAAMQTVPAQEAPAE